MPAGLIVILITVIVIGWEEESYVIRESMLTTELCAVVSSGEIQQPLIVNLFYGDGNATG